MADAPMIDFAHLPHSAPVPSETRDQALADPGFGSLFTDHMVTIAYDADRAERGESVKKREDTHRMAETNKAFAHFRW